MKNKYAFEVGERKPNPKCPCPLEDKSNCFLEFNVVNVGTKKESSYWKIICPHINEISRRASENANKLLSHFL